MSGAGHRPRKRFGQHFLRDASLIDAIVRTIQPLPGQTLVEIGPGLGALTYPLLERAGALTVIELDRDLARRLRLQPGLQVIEEDVLKVDFRNLQTGLSSGSSDDPGAPAAAAAAAAASASAALRVVGNLPYNISTPILFHLLDYCDVVQDQHFMLQKEVVARMAASPGNKDYGRLSVMLQWRYDIESVLDVPPEAFDPPPRVQSAIVRMLPRPAPPGLDRQRLGALVTVAFSQRRKLLRHTLGAWIQAQGLHTAFDLQRRAEEVPVAEYVALAMA